ncbi:cupin domain-containing protein [Dongia sp.]|uniref:cupin domain-containing protein n=1 Tax=Dongia sp. TaxID=1977262 RepID=UPI0035B159A4
MQQPNIRVAQIVIPCRDLAANLRFFTERLGFRVNMIVPADAPAIAVIGGHGTILRLEADPEAAPSTLTLRLLCDLSSLPAETPRQLTAPNGMAVELVEAQPAMVVPEGIQEFVLSRNNDAKAWGTGRAGMQYRDLIPSRLGGRFIASHIRIPEGGPVPDYVHFHKVRFQMIFCKTGWAKLVYEDQGEPFLLEAGDCVLQPPEIRHRVLESSAGLEVIEIGCPAVHETFADHNMALPTGRLLPERDFGGQRFVRHIAAKARWVPWCLAGFEARDIGIAAATGKLAGVRVVRPLAGAKRVVGQHGGEFMFLFVLKGSLDLDLDGEGAHRLNEGDSCVLPQGARYALTAAADLEFLDVTLPG